MHGELPGQVRALAAHYVDFIEDDLKLLYVDDVTLPYNLDYDINQWKPWHPAG